MPRKRRILGWLNLPSNYDKKEFEKIKQSAKKYKNHQIYCL